jgi:hypothetical protein
MEYVSLFHGHLVYFMAFLDIYAYLVFFMVIWYIFPCVGILYNEKSGNPGSLSQWSSCAHAQRHPP